MSTGAMRSIFAVCRLQSSGEMQLHIKQKFLCLKYKVHFLTIQARCVLLLFFGFKT